MGVLIFEKSAEITQRLIGLVQESGRNMNIYHTDSHSDAVSYICQKEINAALLDLNFGDNESIDLLDMMKKINPCMLVVMLYTHMDEKKIKLCKTNGADFVFDKHNDFGRIPTLMNFIPAT